MLIALTQRVEVTGFGERRDCLDQQWTMLLEGLGYDVVPVPNLLANSEEWLNRLQPGGLLLTGGNDLAHLPNASQPAPERDATEQALLGWARSRQCPVLGVCRGMQMLNHFLGGGLTPVAGHVACRHGVLEVGASARLVGYLGVNSFHNWGIMPHDLAAGWQLRFCAEGGSVEAFEHEHLPWVGIMWHPEREAPVKLEDKRLIQLLFSG